MYEFFGDFASQLNRTVSVQTDCGLQQPVIGLRIATPRAEAVQCLNDE
jgi:hypothetical protein